MIATDAEKQAENMITFSEVALAFIEAVKNPKAVEALRTSLIDAATMSDAKRKEAADAGIAIIESNKIIAKAEKALNDVEVARGFANQQAKIQKDEQAAALADLDGKRVAFKTEVDAKMAEIEAMKASLVASHTAVDGRNTQLDARETAMNVRDSNINAKEARLGEREASVSAAEAAVKAAQDDLASRNQRLIDAAMGKI